jgi:hypothetical protein
VNCRQHYHKQGIIARIPFCILSLLKLNLFFFPFYIFLLPPPPVFNRYGDQLHYAPTTQSGLLPSDRHHDAVTAYRRKYKIFINTLYQMDQFKPEKWAKKNNGENKDD